MKNILHIVLHMGPGGLEHVAMEICKRVDKNKFKVFLLCIEACEPEYKDKFKELGIEVYIIKKTKKIDIFFYKKVTTLLNKLKIDVVHIHSCLFDSVLCTFFSKVRGVLFTAHGMPVATDPISKIQEFIGLLLVKHIVVVNKESGHYYKNRLKILNKSPEVLYNGVDVTIFQPSESNNNNETLKYKLNIPSDAIIIGTVGRLEDVKNYEMLLHTFNKLLSYNNTKMHLVFIGDGSKREYLENLSANLGIKKHISFLGIQQNISELIKLFDIFTLTSKTEGTSISLLEAQACGIPAVVTDVGGNSNIIKEGFNGYLCPLNDYFEMAQKLSLIIKDKHLAKRMRINARKEIEKRFSVASMIKAYQNIYQNIM